MALLERVLRVATKRRGYCISFFDHLQAGYAMSVEVDLPVGTLSV